MEESPPSHIQIGSHLIPASQCESAIDSRPLLDEGEFSLLAERFDRDGYLYFSNLLYQHEAQASMVPIERLAPKNSFEANLSTGMGIGLGNDNEPGRWKSIGMMGSTNICEHAMLTSTILQVLEHDREVAVPPKGSTIPFELIWVRGKAPGDGSEIHVDYYHVENRTKDEDLHNEHLFKSFNVWTLLSDSDPKKSSMLAVAPGSHKLDFETTRRKGVHLPPQFQQQLDEKTAKFHIVDSAQQGGVVLLNLKLAHGATENRTDSMRVSLDARFRLRVRGAREIVYGEPPAPHWGVCQRWTPSCHLMHSEMHLFAVSWILVNKRLKAAGEVFLLPELVRLVLEYLNEMVTPLWLPNTLRQTTRYRRRLTGSFPLGGYESESTYESEATGSDWSSD